MKYIYKITENSFEQSLLMEVSSACERLHEKLRRIKPDSLGISEYNQKYLASKLTYIESSLALYAYLLLLCLSEITVPFDKLVLIDYGGGIGILSMLAKEIGIGKVIYNDIYDISCRDMLRLSEGLGLVIDHTICGDMDDVLTYLNEKSIDIDIIVSYDVIEHIYNIEGFFNKMPLLSQHEFRAVHASAANTLNPFYVRRVKKLHRDREFNNRKKLWGWKERDTIRSYLDVRKELISSHAPELNDNEIEKLAYMTRGLWKNEIEKCVEEYKRTGYIFYRPQHSTNTCDPYTGNWAEHLMEVEWLEKILVDLGFSVQIRSGYRLCCGRFPAKIIKYILNWLEGNLGGKKGLWFSPYYVLCADYSQTNNVCIDTLNNHSVNRNVEMPKL